MAQNDALTEGFHDVPAGHLAMVVTTLEMTAPAPLRDVSAPDGVALRHVTKPSSDWYRDLFLRVGGQDWLWFSRLNMPDAELRAILDDPLVEVRALEAPDGRAVGLLELDFRTAGEVELAFFGLTSEMIGTGAGGWLMNQAITNAWRDGVTRFHVHTCTIDSPQALGFYRRSGFTPIKQQIEIAADPRLSGGLPQNAGAHVPIIA